jgi:hypothetical protein
LHPGILIIERLVAHDQPRGSIDDGATAGAERGSFLASTSSTAGSRLRLLLPRVRALLLRHDKAALPAQPRDPNPHVERQAREHNGEHAGDRGHDLATLLDGGGDKTNCTRDNGANIPLHRVSVPVLPESPFID